MGSGLNGITRAAPKRAARSSVPYVLSAIAVALLLGILAAGFYMYRLEALDKDYNQAAAAALAQASQFLSSEVDVIAGDALLMSSTASSKRAPEVAKQFQAFLRLRPNYRYIVYVDNQGREVLRADRSGSVAATDEQQRALLRWPHQISAASLGPGQLFASAPMHDIGDNPQRTTDLVIYFATPRFDDHLWRQGAIVIAYDVGSLLDGIRSLPYEAHGRFDFIDGFGNAIDSAPPPLHFGERKYRWTTSIALAPTIGNSGAHLTLQYRLADTAVALAKRTQLSWAVALWSIMSALIAGLAFLARRARDSELGMTLLLAASQERLLEAEQLARIGYWQWQAQDDVLVLSPQAAAMLGREAGEQHMNLNEATALHIFEDEKSFSDRIVHVMNTGETSRADTRVVTLRGDRWLHSIIRPARDAARNIVGVFGTLQDITARKKIEDELRTLKTDYLALLDHIPAGVIYMDLDGRCLMVNETVLQRSGLSRDHWEGRLLQDIFTPESVASRLQVNAEVIRTAIPKLGLVEEIKRRDGSVRWLRTDVIPRHDAKGRIIGVVVFTLDITQLKRVEDELRATSAEREMVLNRIPAFVIYKDLAGHILHANRMASVYAGIAAEELVGRSYSEIFPHANPHLLRSNEEEMLRTGQPKLGILESIPLRDGATQWFEIDIFPTLDATGQINGMVVFGLDVSERKRAEQQIAYLAMHDPLTDLCNRRLLTDRLAQAIAYCRRRERRCALLFIDLDHFKQVNDLHGHEIGDLLLVEAAHRLRSCVRTEDTAARTGGDEFVALLPDISGIDDAVRVAEKIRAELSRPFDIHGLQLAISSSVGVACYPEHGQTERELLCGADAAMYAAKTSGRGAIRVATISTTVADQHNAA